MTVNKQTHPAYMTDEAIREINEAGRAHVAALREKRLRERPRAQQVLDALVSVRFRTPTNTLRQDFQDTMPEGPVEISQSGGHVQLHEIQDPTKLGESWT